MKTLLITLTTVLFCSTALAEDLTIAFDRKLKPVLGETLTVALKDLSCDIQDGDFSNGASFPDGTVSFAIFTNAEGQVVELETPVEATIYPGPQPSCRAFNRLVRGASAVKLNFDVQLSGIFYKVQPIR